MQELAPRAIGFRFGFADGALKRGTEGRLLVVVAFEVRTVLVAPVNAQDFLQRVAGRLAAWAVERRDDGGVFDIAHEIRSSPRPISPYEKPGATGMPVPAPPGKPRGCFPNRADRGKLTSAPTSQFDLASARPIGGRAHGNAQTACGLSVTGGASFDAGVHPGRRRTRHHVSLADIAQAPTTPRRPRRPRANVSTSEFAKTRPRRHVNPNAREHVVINM